jgi:predicted nucleic acid-binding protein
VERPDLRAFSTTSVGAWAKRHSLRPADALYVELAESRGLSLVTTDRRLHATSAADVVTS